MSTARECETVTGLRGVPRPFWYALVMVFISMLLSTGLTIWYAHQVGEETGRKFCSIVVRLDDTYRAHPPETETGREIAEDMARLRADLHCNERGM